MPTTTPAPITTTELSGDDAQIRALIDKYWAEWLLAGDPPDPRRTSFTDLLTGDALQRSVAELEKLKAVKESRRPPAESKFTHATLSVVVTGDVAKVVECVVDDMQILDTADGRMRNDSVATFRLEAVVARVAGQWRIERSWIIDEKQGIQPCPA